MTNKVILTILILLLRLSVVQSQTFTDFRFTSQATGWDVDLVGAINQQTRVITFTTQRWIEDISQLAATFTLAGSSEVRVGAVAQTSGVTVNDFRRDVVYTIGSNTIYTVRFVSPQASGLPVIKIETVEGATINSRDIWTNMQSFVLQDPNNPANNISKVGATNQTGTNFHRIRGRGNSTWGLPKKPYRVRFREDVSFFGLPAAENWVLLANYNDRSLIKTSVVFELGKRLGVPYTPSYNHVELYLNGSYQGSYLWTEHRQADPNKKGAPGRVHIDLTTGWLTEFDFRWIEEVEDAKFRTPNYNYNLPIVIKSPGEGNNINDPVYDIVKNDWNTLSSIMASSNFPLNGFREMVDIPSFINFFLVHIIAQNTDFYRGLDTRTEPGSIFIHRKDPDSPITAGPLWDFDLSFGVGSGLSQNSFNIRPYPTYPFFERFFDDPVFRVQWKNNWLENLVEITSMLVFIDELAEKLTKSAVENNKLWFPSENYNSRINELKTFYQARINYLNTEYNRIPSIKIDPDYTVPTGLTATFGTRLMNVELPAGWSWEGNPLAHVGYVGTQTHKATYTPENTDIYNVVTGIDVQIVVTEAPPGSTTDSPEIDETTVLRVIVSNGVAIVKGEIAGKVISVCNAAGALIYQNIATSNEVEIPLQTQGMYVIIVGGKTVKIVF